MYHLDVKPLIIGNSSLLTVKFCYFKTAVTLIKTMVVVLLSIAAIFIKSNTSEQRFAALLMCVALVHSMPSCCSVKELHVLL